MQSDPLPPSEQKHDRLEQLDEEERWQASQRRHWFFHIVLTLLVLALAGAAWYAFPIVKNSQTGFAQLPDLKKQVGALGDDLEAAGTRADQWLTSQKTFSSRTEKALGEMRGRLEQVTGTVDAVKAQATEAVERVEHEFGSKIDTLQTQFAEFQSGRSEDRERLASMEDELKQVREQSDKQTEDLAAVTRRVEEQESLNQRQVADVTDLKQTERRDRHDFDALSDKMSVERVDFEATKNHQSDVAPGITLAVTGIDVPYHRFSGRVWVLTDRRTIWIRGQGEQQPVEFYSAADGRKRELVITHLNNNSVAGYLLLPKPPGAAVASPAAE